MAVRHRLGCLLVRPSDRVVPEWLSFWLGQPEIHRWLLNQSVGATMANLNTDILSRLPVTLPSPVEQVRIAGVLGAFDDLIETNRNLAGHLDDMLFAQCRLFAVEAPTVTFDELATRVVDRVAPGSWEPSTTYLGLEHFGVDGVGLSGQGTVDGIRSASLRFKAGDVLYGKLRPYFRKVARPGFSGVCSAEIWVLRPHMGHSRALLHAVTHSPAFSATAMAGNSGTKMPRADWDHVAKLAVPDLRYVLTAQMSEALDALWIAACQLRSEADQLARQRDELLPLLMSGKVRVSDLEGVV